MRFIFALAVVVSGLATYAEASTKSVDDYLADHKTRRAVLVACQAKGRAADSDPACMAARAADFRLKNSHKSPARLPGGKPYSGKTY